VKFGPVTEAVAAAQVSRAKIPGAASANSPYSGIGTLRIVHRAYFVIAEIHIPPVRHPFPDMSYKPSLLGG